MEQQHKKCLVPLSRVRLGRLGSACCCLDKILAAGCETRSCRHYISMWDEGARPLAPKEWSFYSTKFKQYWDMLTHCMGYHIRPSREVWKSNFWRKDQRWEESEKRKSERRRSEKRRKNKKYQSMRKGRKVAKHCVFPMFWGSGRSEGRPANASNLGGWEIKNCTPLWREADLERKMPQSPQLGDTFGSWDVEQVYGAVAQSKFRSQNLQTTPMRSTSGSCAVEKLHVIAARSTCWSQKRLKHFILGTLLEVEMSKRCTRLWCEAHVKVKIATAPWAWVLQHKLDYTCQSQKW